METRSPVFPSTRVGRVLLPLSAASGPAARPATAAVPRNSRREMLIELPYYELGGQIPMPNGLGMPSPYSSRSAWVGSRPAARRAGSQHASMAIAKKSAATAAKVGGSVALTPTSMLVMTRVRANAAARPSTMPPALRAQALADQKLENAAGSRPERHADADLGRALAHQGRQHAVKPHTRHQH